MWYYLYNEVKYYIVEVVFMDKVIIGLIIFLMVVVIFYLYIAALKQKNMKALEEKLSQYGTLKKEKGSYEYSLKRNGNLYKIKVCYANHTREVSFNSRKHWQLTNSNGSKMLNTKGFEDVSGNKICLIVPNVEKVIRYINENEVVFVKPSMDIWGMNVLLVSQLDAYFNVSGVEK